MKGNRDEDALLAGNELREPGESPAPAADEPQIFAIKREGSSWKLDRRSFIAASAAVAMPVILAGCGIGDSDTNAQDHANIKPIDTSQQIFAHQDSVTGLAISSAGNYLASCSVDKTVKLWSLPEGGYLKTMQGHTDSVDSVVFDYDGSYLVSGGSDRTIKIWFVYDGQLSQSMTVAEADCVVPMASSPNKGLLVSGNSANGKIDIWALPGGSLLKTLEGRDTPTGLYISKDGNTLITGGFNGRFDRWSFPEGKLKKSFTTDGMNVSAMVVSPDEDRAAFSSFTEKIIRIVDLSNGDQQKTLSGHSEHATSLAISPDGKILASGSKDTTINLWSFPDGKLLKTLNGHTDTVLALAITPDGETLVSAGKDKRIILWTLPEGTPYLMLMDLAANESNSKGSQCKVKNAAGTWTTYTLPCGTPIPEGAVCTCNCVPGTMAAQPVCSCQNVGPSQPVCSTDNVCNCVGVCNCESVGGGHYWYPN
ncbi:MAG: WD40 repeat domain-containing protein [Deltaproteobacteria bacterium]